MNKEVNISQKSAARLAATQALYQMEMIGTRVDVAIREFVEKRVLREEAGEFDTELFGEIVRGVNERMGDIDAILGGALDAKWPLERLEKILKAILRAGVSELLQSKTDSGIIINDYVNVAHDFFAGKEPALVNAILDKVAKTVRS